MQQRRLENLSSFCLLLAVKCVKRHGITNSYKYIAIYIFIYKKIYKTYKYIALYILYIYNI